MNKINNFMCTNSTREKSSKDKTLTLIRSRATLAKNHARSKNSKRSIQQNYTPLKKKKEPPDYCSLTFRELARPNMRRINSIFEKQRIKSKFDMMKAEKFVKLLQEPVTTPKEFKKHLENRNKKVRGIKKKQTINKTVDDLCNKLKENNFGKFSNDEYKKLLEKLAICNDDESSEDEPINYDDSPSTGYSYYRPLNFDSCLSPNRFVWNPEKCLPIDDCILKEPQNFRAIGESLRQPKNKSDSGENLSTIDLISPELSKFNSLNIGNSTKILNGQNFSSNIQENSGNEIIENFSITIPQVPPQKHNVDGQFSEDVLRKISKSRNPKIAPLKINRETTKLILEEFPSNRRNLIPNSSSGVIPVNSILQPHQPSFARNFPVSTPQKINDKIIRLISDDHIPSNASILTDISDTSNASKFDTFVEHLATAQTSQKQYFQPNKVIALRELTDEDLRLKTDSEIIVRVTKQDFSKTYIMKKLETVESFQVFCKSSIAKRSNLFKMKDDKIDSSIRVKQLPQESFHSASENYCQKSDKLSNKNEVTFSVQKVTKATNESVQIDSMAFDIKVKKDPLDDSNFIVRKK